MKLDTNGLILYVMKLSYWLIILAIFSGTKQLFIKSHLKSFKKCFNVLVNTMRKQYLKLS